MSRYTNMAAVPLFWNTNMAAVTSCENALLFSTLVIGQNLLTQKNTLLKWSVNAFYCVNGLHVGLCILCVKMRTFLFGESTVAA